MAENKSDNNFFELLGKNMCSEQIEQVAFLYAYLKKNNKESMFPFILNDITDRGSTSEEIQEIVKCVTHGLPYSPLFGDGNTNKDMMIEIRRFMEDAGCTGNGSDFMFIAENLGRYFDDKNKIYEFRRFNKSSEPIGFEQDMQLFKWCTKVPGGVPWMVISAMYEAYEAYGFDRMMRFGKSWEEEVTVDGITTWDPCSCLEMLFASNNVTFEEKDIL